jgi:hypothetical protein
MGEILRNTSVNLTKLFRLRQRRDEARDHFFLHRNPGNLTPAENTAFAMEAEAYELLLRAAQIRLDAEEELQRLLAAEHERAT